MRPHYADECITVYWQTKIRGCLRNVLLYVDEKYLLVCLRPSNIIHVTYDNCLSHINYSNTLTATWFFDVTHTFSFIQVYFSKNKQFHSSMVKTVFYIILLDISFNINISCNVFLRQTSFITSVPSKCCNSKLWVTCDLRNSQRFKFRC